MHSGMREIEEVECPGTIMQQDDRTTKSTAPYTLCEGAWTHAQLLCGDLQELCQTNTYTDTHKDTLMGWYEPLPGGSY